MLSNYIYVYIKIYIYRSGIEVERSGIDHSIMGHVMCRLFLQPFMHSGLLGLTRTLLHASNDLIKQYNLISCIGSDRMDQIVKQFQFNKFIPTISSNIKYLYLISNQFRMTIPFGYSRRIKLSDTAINSRSPILSYRNNFVFDDNNVEYNINLWSIYDNLCNRLYNSWLLDKFNVSLKIATNIQNPWSLDNYGGANSDISSAMELSNLDTVMYIKEIGALNRKEVLSREISLLQSMLQRHNHQLEHGINLDQPVNEAKISLDSNIIYQVASDVEHSDDECLNLNPLNGISICQGIFTMCPYTVSLDMKNGYFLIDRILCYIECDDSTWSHHYLVNYWRGTHISTYEHRDNICGGMQEYWWSHQPESAGKTDIMQYLQNRAVRELKHYKQCIINVCKRYKLRSRDYTKNLNLREFEHPDLLKLDIRNPWLKHSIIPSENDILSMELKWQDRAFYDWSILEQRRRIKKYCEMMSNNGSDLSSIQDFCEICSHWFSLDLFLDHGCFDLRGDSMKKKSNRKKSRIVEHLGLDNVNDIGIGINLEEDFDNIVSYNDLKRYVIIYSIFYSNHILYIHIYFFIVVVYQEENENVMIIMIIFHIKKLKEMNFVQQQEKKWFHFISLVIFSFFV